MVLLLQLLLQRRQRRLRRRHLRFLGQHVGAVGGADFELIAHDFELVGFRLDDFLRRLDLAAQRSFLDRRRHHVGGERQVGRFELEALILGKRRVGLDLSPLAAEHVGRIGDVHGGLVEVENGRRAGQAEFRRRELLTGDGAGGVDTRQQFAGGGVEVLLRLPQRRLRGLKVRIGTQRFGDQRVDLLRMEHLPPLGRNVAADDELLRRAAGDVG